ncbi:hypothetical protein AW734_12770 [Pantoea ananatis]|nr:hypothetical protein AW734_12770 [Pantoea ananatis]
MAALICEPLFPVLQACRFGLPVLVKIPTVAIEVFKNHNQPILFLSGFLTKRHIFRSHGLVVVPEIIALQEHSAAALITNKAFLTVTFIQHA